ATMSWAGFCPATTGVQPSALPLKALLPLVKSLSWHTTRHPGRVCRRPSLIVTAPSCPVDSNALVPGFSTAVLSCTGLAETVIVSTPSDRGTLTLIVSPCTTVSVVHSVEPWWSHDCGIGSFSTSVLVPSGANVGLLQALRNAVVVAGICAPGI